MSGFRHRRILSLCIFCGSVSVLSERRGKASSSSAAPPVLFAFLSERVLEGVEVLYRPAPDKHARTVYICAPLYFFRLEGPLELPALRRPPLW